MLPSLIPFTKTLNIELYNEKWFNKPPKNFSLPFTYDHATLLFPSEVIAPFPTLSKLHEETNTFPLYSIFFKVDIPRIHLSLVRF